MQTIPSSHQAFNQDTFNVAFVSDLKRARASVIIQSPFLSPRRIRELAYSLKSCIKRKVRVCVIAQEPREAATHSSSELRSQVLQGARSMLSDLQIHLTFRPLVHEKLAIIDELIVWEGSLNILSHFNTSERMTRWLSRHKVEEVISKHHSLKCQICDHLFLESLGAASQSDDYLATAARQRRIRLGLSQRDLAHQVGISQNVISLFESGKRTLSLGCLRHLYQALGLRLLPVPYFAVPMITGALLDCQSPNLEI